MRRINVIGSSGSGKTTVATEIADRLAIPRLELDSIFHQPDWEPLETEEFRRQVTDFTGAQAWVVDGNYSNVRDLVWGRADTVIFLDHPRWRVMSRLIPRTLRRMVTGEELWNGNRERWSNLFSRDPELNLLVWSWTRHQLVRDRFVEAIADQTWADITFVHLHSPAEVSRFVERIEVS